MKVKADEANNSFKIICSLNEVNLTSPLVIRYCCCQIFWHESKWFVSYTLNDFKFVLLLGTFILCGT